MKPKPTRSAMDLAKEIEATKATPSAPTMVPGVGGLAGMPDLPKAEKVKKPADKPVAALPAAPQPPIVAIETTLAYAKTHLDGALANTKAATAIVLKSKEPHKKLLFRRLATLSTFLEEIVENWAKHTAAPTPEEEALLPYPHLDSETFARNVRTHLNEETERDTDMRIAP